MGSTSPYAASFSLQGPRDPRVAMVLEVLAGSAPADVAERWSTDLELVHRWVRGFVDAGTALVTNRPLGAAAKERDRFLTAFGHEVRTPLAVVRLWVDLLSADDLAPAMLARGLVTLQRAVERLTDRIIDAELLAAASLGRVDVSAERVSIEDLVADLPPGSFLGAEAAPTHVIVDRDKFRRVLRDLWYAASMPPEPTALHLETALVGPWVEVRVVREAAPLSPDLLRHLMEPFSKDNVNNDGSGVTIGLYLARALTVAHGGTLGIEQDDERLVIWVRVPQHPVAHPYETSAVALVDARPMDSTRLPTPVTAS